MNLLEVLGWAGSALLVYSLLQTRVLRFRLLNGVASALLVVYNAFIPVWPMVGLNLVLTGINAWYVHRLLRSRHEPSSYDVIAVDPGEGVVRHVLRTFDADIRRFNPGFSPEAANEAGLGFLIVSGAETVGLVLARDVGEGAVQVILDYVLPKYRDFTPGEFVYRRGGPFTVRGFRRVIAPPAMRGAEEYLHRVGFRRRDDALVLDLA